MPVPVPAGALGLPTARVAVASSLLVVPKAIRGCRAARMVEGTASWAFAKPPAPSATIAVAAEPWARKRSTGSPGRKPAPPTCTVVPGAVTAGGTTRDGGEDAAITEIGSTSRVWLAVPEAYRRRVVPTATPGGMLAEDVKAPLASAVAVAVLPAKTMRTCSFGP